MSPWLLFAAAIDGAAFVILGAMGSHGRIVAPEVQRLFDIANAYHAWHALAVLGVAIGLAHLQGLAKRLAWLAAVLLIVGSLLFCGPLYIRAFFETPVFGPLTPVGGVLLIVGWLLLAAAGGAAWRRRRD